MDAAGALRRLPLRDREPLPAAGARARRSGRAADVARQPPGRRRRTTPTGRCRRRTRSFRRSRCRPARRSPSRTGSTARSSRRAASRRTAEAAFRALHETYQATLNTYATLYNAVCQRDWFQARARGYDSTLEAALHGDNIPTSVVENLIETTRAGVEPLRRYHRLRRKTLGVPVVPRLRLLDPARHLRQEVPLRRGARLDRRGRRAARRRTTRRGCAKGSRAAGSTCTRTRASARARTRRRCTARIRTCCSTTPTRWTTCSRWRTRWGTRCTPSCRTRRSRSSIRATRSSSPRCRRR